MGQMGRPRTIDRDKVISLRLKGLKVQVVADRVGCSQGYVSQVCPTTHRKVEKWTDDELRFLEHLVAVGRSQTEIARRMERTLGSIAGKIAKLGGARAIREEFYGKRS